ncbi:MAG: DUF4389 domain-containing protein [Chloroflexi bacterium]|nr:DUF4389 domain-containing protein [Chloroflexota bacterium]
MDRVEASYPVQFWVDYPEGPRNRLTTFFRLFTVIPIGIVMWLVSGSASSQQSQSGLAQGGILFFAPMLMILFRRKYPRWWFDWNLALLKFGYRVGAYFALLRDEYPSTDDEQSVHLHIAYPDADQPLNRWLPLVKWLLAVPHYIALLLLSLAGLAVIVTAWFLIVFTGRFPRGLFDFVVGVSRWGNRVLAYAFMLTTDRYPPFRLSA